MYNKTIVINGLGRIGRLVLRIMLEYRDDFNIIPNSPGEDTVIAHLINYDSVHGPIGGSKCYVNHAHELVINSMRIPLFHEHDISKIPVSSSNTNIMLECSGKLSQGEILSVQSSYEHVVISAPCNYADSTVIVGVNDMSISKHDYIISLGSCTANAFIPVVKILHDAFHIEAGHVTTVHAYTNDQNLVDGSHKDLCRGRAAGLSIIPTNSGVSRTLLHIIPELQDKITSSSLRVPVPNVSLFDFSFHTKKSISVDLINEEMLDKHKQLSNIINVTHERLVSIDYNHTPYSVIFDQNNTNVIAEMNFGRVACWYDNEWAYANRIMDICNTLIKMNMA